MSTRLIVEDDIIYNFFEGSMTLEMIEQNESELDQAIEKQRLLNKKVLILLDISTLDGHSAEARKSGVDWIHKSQFDKYAILGGSIYLKYLANFIIQATGKSDQMKHFDNKDDAVEWLRS